jgi:malonate transporter
VNAIVDGFVTLAAVIAVGWLVGRTGVLGPGAGQVLSRLSYFVATPALLLLTMAETKPSALLSPALVATAGSAVLCAVLYVGLARWRWRLRPAELAAGGLAASYVNAGNLGLAIAAYVLGDASVVAPVLLFQILVIAPIGLTVLARSTAVTAQSRWQVLTQPLRTPIVVGCGLGVAVAASGAELPGLVREPLHLVAALAIPAALLAYGTSLHGAPRPASGAVARQVWLVVALKVLAQPVAAYVLGRWVVGLDGAILRAVTVTSALPTAQNVFVYVSTFGRGVLVARDAILLTTLLSVPVLIGVAVLLG